MNKLFRSLNKMTVEYLGPDRFDMRPASPSHLHISRYEYEYSSVTHGEFFGFLV